MKWQDSGDEMPVCHSLDGQRSIIKMSVMKRRDEVRLDLAQAMGDAAYGFLTTVKYRLIQNLL